MKPYIETATEYAPSWLAEGFSISPLELPLRQGLFLAKPSPFYGNIIEEVRLGCDDIASYHIMT